MTSPILFTMRLWFTLAVLLVGAGAGCAHRTGPSEPNAPGSEKVSHTTPAKAKKPADSAPYISASRVGIGTVVSANGPLRFVVLDYGYAPLPASGQVLYLYRKDQKVAELRVSGPSMNTHTVADIVSGDAQAGDEARED